MGLLSEGWVWILTNDISPVLKEVIKTPEELAKYDGLMFISGLWDCELWYKYQLNLSYFNSILYLCIEIVCIFF